MGKNLNPEFSVVIPCYNESSSLAELMKKCNTLAEISNGEFILVDNGSTDDTKAILENLQNSNSFVKVVFVPTNQGYGFGILKGLEAAKAPIVGWTHADLQTDPADVLRAIDKFQENEKIFLKGKRYARPVSDRIFTAGMSLFESLILKGKYRDINGQPTLFTSELMETWQNPPHDFSLDLYAYASAKKNGYRFVRIPVIFDARKYGKSSWNFGIFSRLRLIMKTLNYSFQIRKLK